MLGPLKFGVGPSALGALSGLGWIENGPRAMLGAMNPSMPEMGHTMPDLRPLSIQVGSFRAKNENPGVSLANHVCFLC